MTVFALWLHLCGISQREAAAVLDVSLRSVEDYYSGRRQCPPGILSELRTLRGRIEQAAREGFAAWKEAGRAGSVDLGIAADDQEARSIGWPCIGAQRASLALLMASLPPEVETRVMPRGSTRPYVGNATNAITDGGVCGDPARASDNRGTER